MLKEVTFGVTFFLLAITLTSAERPEAFKRYVLKFFSLKKLKLDLPLASRV